METRNPRGWVSGRKWIWFLSPLSIGRHCPWLQVVGVLIGGGRWGGGLHQWPDGAFLSPALCNGLFKHLGQGLGEGDEGWWGQREGSVSTLGQSGEWELPWGS